VPAVLDQRPLKPAPSFQVHGTTVAISIASAAGDWVAVLIKGRPGRGKSDLALRCLNVPPSPLLPHTVRLVADDRTDVTVANGHATASGPATTCGLLEVRGIGILAVPYVLSARLVLVVDLVDPADVPRFPEAEQVELKGKLAAADGSVADLTLETVIRLPHIVLAPFEASAPLKLLLALARTAQTGTPVGADAAKPHHLPEGL
jgi:HPr kinase/phosphorylase